MGVQRAPVVEADQQVLAVGVGTEQRGVGEVEADEAWVTGDAALATLPGEAPVDPLGQPSDRVALRHQASDQASAARTLKRRIAASGPSAMITSTASAASCTATSNSSRWRVGQAIEDVVGAALLGRRLADADAHANEVVGAEMRRDAAQAVVPGEPAADLDAHGRRREVELVVDDDDLARLLDPEAPGEGAHRQPGVVHVRQREGEHGALVADARLGHEGVVAT